MSHARLAPSAAKRWMTCPASIWREAGMPDDESEYARWGTASHAILEQSLLQETHPLDLDIKGLSLTLSDGTERVIDQYWGLHDVLEMRETAAVAYEHTLFKGDVQAECRVNPGVAASRDDCYGTADIQIHAPLDLEVVDLKAGKGVLVDADDPQLKLYAAGALAGNPERYHAGDYHRIKVRTTVVQPRADHPEGPVRSREYTALQLMQWFHDEMAPAMARTDDPNAPAVPSEDACRWCKAKATCRERGEAAMAAVQMQFQPVAVGGNRDQLAQALTQDPNQLTMEQVRFILDNEALITGWLKSVHEFAYQVTMAGGHVPGYKLVEGRGSRKFDLDDKELVKLFKALVRQDGKKVTKAQYTNETLLSPAQAEKILQPLLRKDSWEKLKEHIQSQPGKPQLAPDSSSKREVVRDASQIFQPVAGDEPDYLT